MLEIARCFPKVEEWSMEIWLSGIWKHGLQHEFTLSPTSYVIRYVWVSMNEERTSFNSLGLKIVLFIRGHPLY